MKPLLLFVLLLTALTGCSTDECEAAVDVINDKAVECGLVSDDQIESANDGSSRECTEENANVLTRQADCTQAATCDALSGRDVAGNADYSACVAGP